MRAEGQLGARREGKKVGEDLRFLENLVDRK